LDVSATAVDLCRERFREDPTKSFALYEPTQYRMGADQADLALSLDVVYHLVEQTVFERHLRHVFGAASRFVIVYSSNVDAVGVAPHIRHRRFTDWVGAQLPEWSLIETRQNRYPGSFDHTDETSFAQFHFFEKRA
jgi:hypothetical protein